MGLFLYHWEAAINTMFAQYQIGFHNRMGNYKCRYNRHWNFNLNVNLKEKVGSLKGLNAKKLMMFQ